MNLENCGNHPVISTCLTLEKMDLGLSPLPEQRCIRIPEPKHVQCSKNPSGGDDCILRRKGYNPNYTFEGRFSVTWMLSQFDLHPCREKTSPKMDIYAQTPTTHQNDSPPKKVNQRYKNKYICKYILYTVLYTYMSIYCKGGMLWVN